ncbi:MAG: tRNA uridine(34) 5-carboxymethylaminomethyl modification radical SAM/GNAT enzyme Elp3 [Candidatus Aenigmatarchaeota archaeon]
MSFDAIYNELIEKIKNKEIRNQKELEKEKIIIAKKYNIDRVIKNADLIAFLEKKDKNYKNLKKFLKTKPVRTASGVANIAVMWIDKNNTTCPGQCIYCPQGKYSPKSYTGTEPATMRAIQTNYDPYMQVKTRLRQLEIIGHPTDKCELIIMGGTFISTSKKFQENFIKNCLDAMNGCKSKNLKEAQKRNEKARHRCIGLTIETRADYCKKEHIEQMLKLGCTRVELGVQTTSDKILEKINRGYSTKENIEAIRLLKKAGLKVCVHWMPGLTGLFGKINKRKEIEMFKELFENKDFRPDELKIYPTLVIPGTKLYELWKNNEYKPLTINQTINLLIEMKKIVPKYVRIKRVMRDISHKEVVAGPNATNLRQLIHMKMKESRIKCNCIRCREVGLQNKKPINVKLKKFEYEASNGKEIFLSFEDNKNNLLLAFLRLRIDDDNFAKVRELHVYGPMIPIGKRERTAIQHKGYGKKLLKNAEKIAKEYKKDGVQITSGIGARDYYRKFGYKLKEFYMIKSL